MSDTTTSVFVQARNGAYYEDPILIFPEGYAWVDQNGMLELVLWLNNDRTLAQPETVLDRAFGMHRYEIYEERLSNAIPRLIPKTNPVQFAYGASVLFSSSGRIPVPHGFGSLGVRRVRDKSAHVIGYPAHADDLKEMELPATPARSYLMADMKGKPDASK